ncbi:MAG: VOC family protein [Candidatus Latescibacteria bacterium]|nr:VOC family protein [Candidatus Latescibacterota bacterium]
MIHSLEHVALSVSDMERSLTFYRDFLGMKVVLEVDFSDDRIERITGMPGAKCKVVHLELGNGILELFHYYNPIGKKIPPERRQCDNGFIHIGFRVTDIHEHIQQLKKRGIELLGEPTEIRPGAWVVYFRGPDGEVCEFRQLPG